MGSPPRDLSPEAKRHYRGIKRALGSSGTVADGPLAALTARALADLDTAKGGEAISAWKRAFAGLRALKLSPRDRKQPVVAPSVPTITAAGYATRRTAP